jgi:transposase
MWTVENRGRYERKGQRYPSDLTDEEWDLVEPQMPPQRQGRRFRAADRREIYVLSTGCQWRQLPKDLPPKSTVHEYLIDWHGDGTLARIHRALYEEARMLAGRNPTATTAIVDSQSVKSAEKGGLASILPVMTRARKSKARSATLPSIRSA